MEKNTKAIEKIIAQLSKRDYKTALNKLTKKQKHQITIGKRQFSYSLASDTLEAIEIKRDYTSGNITEEEYKAYCLRFNLINA